MFKKKLVCLLVLSFFTFLVFFGCAPVKTQPLPGEPVAHFPKMQVGDKWEIQRWCRKHRTEKFYYEIDNVNSDGSFESSNSKEKCGYHWISYHNNKYQVEKIVYPGGKTVMRPKPLRTELDFPLFVGKRWKTKYYSYGKSGRPYDYLDMYKVLSYETVKTKAGEFKAFKIRRTNTVIQTGQSRIYTSIEWYSPEVKHRVKVKNPSFPPYELLDYKLAGDE
jgi:hypothetical protein